MRASADIGNLGQAALHFCLKLVGQTRDAGHVADVSCSIQFASQLTEPFSFQYSRDTLQSMDEPFDRGEVCVRHGLIDVGRTLLTGGFEFLQKFESKLYVAHAALDQCWHVDG